MSDDAKPQVETSWQLGAASVNLENLLREVRVCWVNERCVSGECDISFGHGLGRVIENLNLAWHYRLKSPEQVYAESQDEFEAQIATIPRLTPTLRMLTAEDEEMKGGDALPEPVCRWYFPWTWWARSPGNPVMIAELEKARVALLDLRARVDMACLDDQTLASGLANVLGSLNLAWHWRRKSAAHAASLGASAREVLANSIPWHVGTWCLRLEDPTPPATA